MSRVGCRKAQPGSVRPLSLEHTQHLICKWGGTVCGSSFLPSRASVSTLQGIAEALATEDVATLCRSDEATFCTIWKAKLHVTSCAWRPEPSVPPACS